MVIVCMNEVLLHAGLHLYALVVNFSVFAAFFGCSFPPPSPPRTLCLEERTNIYYNPNAMCFVV
jgi:hypothetical protein